MSFRSKIKQVKAFLSEPLPIGGLLAQCEQAPLLRMISHHITVAVSYTHLYPYRLGSNHAGLQPYHLLRHGVSRRLLRQDVVLELSLIHIYPISRDVFGELLDSGAAKFAADHPETY